MLLEAPAQPIHNVRRCTRGCASGEAALAKLQERLVALGFNSEPVDLHKSLDGRPPPVASACESDLAVLIVSTKRLWEGFVRAYGGSSSLQAAEHPLDTYVEQAVSSAADATGCSYRLLFTHDHEAAEGTPCPHNIHMQRLAAANGLVQLEEEFDLCIHPKFGPWIAMRALLVFEGVPYTVVPERRLVYPLTATTRAYIRMALRSAQNGSTQALERAESEAGEPLTWQSMRACWKRWAAVRDVPMPGHPWRYSSDQLEYHYTHDPAVLRRAVRALQLQRQQQQQHA